MARRSIIATIAKADTELLEIFVALFSIRFFVTLMLPIFNSFVDSNSYRFFSETLSSPFIMAAIVVVPIIIWGYGFIYERIKYRLLGLKVIIFLYTLLTIGFLFGDWHKSAWTIYGLVATAAALSYARVRRDA